ncbi:MAG: GNAT family N-acetyltransferase, partial [Nanoarchaeota archaeon]|nr:GNAT family N-acetyltransferase [Nanoarchaeota archaeon]
LVSEEKGNIVGCIGGFILPYEFEKNLIMFQEAFWYVDEEYRGTRISLKLFNAVEQYCRENKVTHIIMGSLGNRRDDALASFYSRKEYKPYESTYIKIIKQQGE